MISQNNGQRSFEIAIVTFRRPCMVADLVAALDSMSLDRPGSNWIYTGTLVIDNDRYPSAREAVAAAGAQTPVRYHHEPEPGLSSARNRALREATADVLVFIDDDERPEPGWPFGLLTVLEATGAALVGGPVRTAYRHPPPGWLLAGRFLDRPEPPDRTPQRWLRSGNLAIDLAPVRAAGLRFDPRYGRSGGEDTAFSLAAARAGLGLQWSATAAVTETVGPERTTLRWLARRERRNTANWVRIELDHHPGPGRHLLVAARAATRLAQGAVTAGAGATRGRYDRMARGCVLAARGLGALEGLTSRTGTPAYGQPERLGPRAR